MASTVGPPPNGTANKTRPIKRSHSLLVQGGRPPVVAQERASSLKREQSLKGPKDLAATYNLQLRSPMNVFRVPRRGAAKKRGGGPTVVDSSYERPTSPLLGFHSPLQVRRGRMVHAKSCDMTPLRLKLSMRRRPEADAESNSSDESWNVAAIELNQIGELNSSPRAQRRKVWSLERNTSQPSSFCPTDSSTTTSRSQSPALLDTSGRPTPDLPLHIPDISVSVATPPYTPRQASLRLKMLRNSRTCHSTSALYSNSTSEVTERKEPILAELLNTERRYLSNLNTLLNTLLPALEDQVAPRDLRLLFPCQLELLLDWHMQLLAQLEDRMNQNSTGYGTVGDVFRQMCSNETGNSEFFNMYSAYMNEFKVAMKTLAKYEHSSQTFRHELRHCQQLPECDGLPLSAYLLTPVQRLPRYELLLKDLLKHTPVDHRDCYYLEDAVELLREELIRLDSSIQSCEVACSVARIRNNGRRSVSIRRLGSRGRMAGRQLAKQLMKHISAVSVEDLSASGANRSHQPGDRPKSTMTLSVSEMRDPALYKSEENLPILGTIGEHDKKVRRPLGSMERTNSCINLATDYDNISVDQKKRYSQPVLETLESQPNTPEPTSPCSMMPPPSETDDSGTAHSAQSSSRVSVYSTTSSTSGIGSSHSHLEGLDSTLTLTPSSPHPPSSPVTPLHSPNTRQVLLEITPTNNPAPGPAHSTPIAPATSSSTLPHPQHRPIIVSKREKQQGGSSAQRRWRKRISWAGAFVMPRIMSKKKPVTSVPDLSLAGKRTTKDISLPMDFRHIQHGFIAASPQPTTTS